MHHEIITAHKRRQPFVPFRIVLDDGSTFEVHDPLNVIASPLLVGVGFDVGPNGVPRESRDFPPERVVRVELLTDSRRSG